MIFLLVELFRAPVVKLEFLLFDDLSVVEEALDASTGWEVAHVDLEPLGVVKLRILGYEEAFSQLAQLRECSTKQGGTITAKWTQNVPDMESAGYRSNGLFHRGCDLEQLSSSMSEPGHWSKCNVQIQPFLPKGLVRRESIEHLRGTLGMADVDNLVLACMCSDVINLCRGVVETHFGE